MRKSIEAANKSKETREKQKRAQANKRGEEYTTQQLEHIADNSKAPALLREMENEVKLLMRLNHPNIIKTYQIIDSEAETFVVMFDILIRQYAENGDLTDLIVTKGTFSEQEAQRIFRQLVSGVDHIHLANVVHRDLKLDNLLLDEHNNILISDFGLGRTFVDTDLFQAYFTHLDVLWNTKLCISRVNFRHSISWSKVRYLGHGNHIIHFTCWYKSIQGEDH